MFRTTQMLGVREILDEGGSRSGDTPAEDQDGLLGQECPQLMYVKPEISDGNAHVLSALVLRNAAYPLRVQRRWVVINSLQRLPLWWEFYYYCQ